MKKVIVTALVVVAVGGVISYANYLGTQTVNNVEVAVLEDRTAPDLQNDENLQRECAQMFRQIINIQDNRESERLAFRQVHDAFNVDGNIDGMGDSRKSWLQKENALATQAANLYTESRSMGCFQKVTVEDGPHGE